jgi:hypothetical protein
MRYRLFTVAILAAFVGAFLVAPASQTSAQPNRGSATATGVDGDGLPVVGTVSNLVASIVEGNVVVSGLFTFTEGANVGEQVEFASILQSASCEILNLVLGPIDLNLLGLEVFVDTITINITAVPGPGNLLGNLLCAVAGLLDRGGPLQGITNLLNNLFRNL